MEWLRSYNILNKQPRALMCSTEEECDPQACYDSFKEHWHQALKIINRTQQLPSHDDVLGVVNHLEQMVTLLLYDVKKIDQLRVPISSSSQCLDYMLNENILDKLFEWGVRAGKYTNAVRCEQLKLYEVLISRSRHVLLVHEPFLRPMLKLLNSCQDDISVPDWRRLTPDDVNDIKGLSTFVTSLEFSNAVAQVAHPLIRKQLQEFLFRGFLIPVLGPALLQSNINEQVAATAYLELILRTVTQPAPICCELPSSPRTNNIHWNHYGGQQSLCGKYHAYLYDARNKIGSCQAACLSWNNSYTGCDEIVQDSTTTEENCNSLPSLGESSGYESLKVKIEDSSDETSVPIWQISSNKVKKSNAAIIDNNNDHLNSSGSAGPFLTILLEKLKNFLSNSFYINLHVTGLISRLAVYPQPLLRTYLLDDSLVLQPNVPSLFQIIGSLKQSIDEYMSRRSDSGSLIKAAKDFLVDRETRLINARRNTLEKSSSVCVEPEPFQRNEPKRRSLNLPSITSMFGRRPSQIAENSVAMVPTSEEYQCNLIYPRFNESQHVALCAVLLDEWVKELAALAQEHTIVDVQILVLDHSPKTC
ncbi:UPF0518 domain containing protein -like [Asbolus verrucosus]|uniref:UPF0518 domain containing protein-like n=1 Tax=Asbolus verrucosus TaxID=1661398 RepID=A0A482V9S0_ASBVE|nr:UPF0518 domain containing protein -like [Asbolus verrucosus]